MSQEANRIIQYMVTNLSTLKYGYRDIVVGCYKAALHHGFALPQESQDEIVNRVIEILEGE